MRFSNALAHMSPMIQFVNVIYESNYESTVTNVED